MRTFKIRIIVIFTLLWSLNCVADESDGVIEANLSLVNRPECKKEVIKNRLKHCRQHNRNSRESILDIDELIEELVQEQEGQQRKYQICLQRKQRVQSRLQNLQSDIRETERSNSRLKQEIQGTRAALKYARNYPKKWKCFVKLRKGRGRFEVIAASPAVGIMKALDMCTAGRGKNCGNGDWNPNGKNRWGCVPAN